MADDQLDGSAGERLVALSSLPQQVVGVLLDLLRAQVVQAPIPELRDQVAMHPLGVLLMRLQGCGSAGCLQPVQQRLLHGRAGGRVVGAMLHLGYVLGEPLGSVPLVAVEGALQLVAATPLPGAVEAQLPDAGADLFH